MTVETDVDILEILITGLPDTGKSSFVRTICEKIGDGADDGQDWFSGELTVDDTLFMRFLEPPAVTMFDFIWLRELIDQADVPGFIVVCDSTQPQFFGETVSLLETIRAYHPDTPCVLVCNKQDNSHAWSPDDIRIVLGIPNDILVLPCIATNRESVKSAVLQLLYRIFG